MLANRLTLLCDEASFASARLMHGSIVERTIGAGPDGPCATRVPPLAGRTPQGHRPVPERGRPSHRGHVPDAQPMGQWPVRTEAQPAPADLPRPGPASRVRRVAAVST